MDPRLDAKTLQARAHDDRGNERVVTAGIVLCGVLALAGIVAIDVIAGPKDNMVRLTLWTSAMMTVWVAHIAARRSWIYAPRRIESIQSLILLAHTLTQIALFAALSNAVVGNRYWVLWCLAQCGVRALTAYHFHLVSPRMARGEVFAIDVESLHGPVAAAIERWKLRGLGFAIAALVIAALGAGAPAGFVQPAKILAAVFAIAVMFIDVVNMSEEDDLVAFVEQKLLFHRT